MAESYLDWWTLAGVADLVSEEPAEWLSAPAAAAAVNDNRPAQKNQPLAASEPPPLPEVLLKKAEEPASKSSTPAIFPDDWDGFHQWLASSEDVPGSQWDGRRILPAGPQGAKYMAITAWPEMDDQRAGEHFCNDAGYLLNQMLKMVGMDRAQCYIASLAITRPAGGRCDAGDLPEMQRMLYHHIRLAKPEFLLLIGSDITQIMTGERLQQQRGKLLNIRQEGVSVPAIALPHPAMLLSRPAHKAAAWDSLKLLVQGN